MSLETLVNKVIFQGNAVTTIFPYTFIIPDADVVVATLTDSSGTQTVLSSSQYTITGIDDPDGGTITYPLVGSPIAVGVTLTLERVVPYTQPTVLINQGGYYPDVVENADDWIVMQTQQLAERVSASLRFPAVDPAANSISELPAWQVRANKFFGFDASGNLQVTDPAGGDPTSAENVNFLPAGGSAVSRTVQSKERDTVSFLDFGATGDGVVDDTVFCQAALAAADAVYVPGGFEFKITAALTLKTNNFLYGRGQITCTAATDVVTATTVNNVGMDGITLKGNAGHYGFHPANNVNYVRMTNCRADTCALFASNSIGSTYGSITETNFVRYMTVTGNKGKTATPTTDIAFICVAYSRNFVVVGNQSEGYKYGVITWGGNTVSQDPIVNERKCYDGVVVGNVMNSVTAGLVQLVCRNVIMDGNAVKTCAEVAIDMESCWGCEINNTVCELVGAGKGLYYYGLNRDCAFRGNTIRLDIGTVMFSNNISPIAGYEDMGTVEFTGNRFMSATQIATFQTYTMKHVVFRNNTFENVQLQVGGDFANSFVNQAQVQNNSFDFTIAPATDYMTQFGGLSAAFNNDYATPQYTISGNTVTFDGVAVAKDGFQFTEFHTNGKVNFTDNVTRGVTRGLLIAANTGVITRTIRINNFDSDATTPITNGDTTYSTIIGAGYWNTPTYASGDYTQTGGSSWGVDSGDVDTMRWTIVGKMLTVRFSLRTTDVGGTPSSLNFKIPGGYTSGANRSGAIYYLQDAGGTVTTGYAEAAAAGTVVNLYNAGLAAWTATASDNTTVQGEIVIEVTQP